MVTKDYDINMNDEEMNEYLIAFYKGQYLYFLRVGIGGYTSNEVEITDTLIKATANRLDQLITGRQTPENMCKGISNTYFQEKRLYNSNRSFGWNNTGKFDFLDLDDKQRDSIINPVKIQPMYIDKYTTAYNSEIVKEELSHKGL